MQAFDGTSGVFWWLRAVGMLSPNTVGALQQVRQLYDLKLLDTQNLKSQRRLILADSDRRKLAAAGQRLRYDADSDDEDDRAWKKKKLKPPSDRRKHSRRSETQLKAAAAVAARGEGLRTGGPQWTNSGHRPRASAEALFKGTARRPRKKSRTNTNTDRV